MSTVIVGSRCLSSLQMPTEAGHVVLHGAAHPGAIGGIGITRDVDKDAFEAWLKDNAAFDPIARGMVYALPEEPEALEPRYGWQPALEEANKDSKAKEAAAKGSKATRPGQQEPDTLPTPTQIEVAQTLGAPNTPAPPEPKIPAPTPAPAPKVEVAPAAPAAPPPPPPPPGPAPADPAAKPLG